MTCEGDSSGGGSTGRSSVGRIGFPLSRLVDVMVVEAAGVPFVWPLVASKYWYLIKIKSPWLHSVSVQLTKQQN